MKIGLLICDHILDEFRDEFGDYPEMFSNLFPKLDFEYFDVCRMHFPEVLEGCDAYFATGSRYSVNDDLPWIQKLKTLVQELYSRQIPFVGYCFGHQLIAAALGGEVRKHPEGWCAGLHEFNIYERPSWMETMSDPLKILMMCQDQVNRLPDKSMLLAGNASCENGIILVGKHMLGIQGHPEFSRAFNHRLAESRADIIGAVKMRQLEDSYKNEPDTAHIRNSVMAFLQARID